MSEFRCNHVSCKDRDPFKNAFGLRMHQARVHSKPKSKSKTTVNGHGVRDVILSVFRDNPGAVISRSEIINEIQRRGVQKKLPSLRSAVTSFLSGNGRQAGIKRIARGQYSQSATAVTVADDTVQVPIKEESAEIVAHERDYYRSRCQQLTEIVMALLRS